VGTNGGKWNLSEASGFIQMQEESIGACQRQLEVRGGHCCSCDGWGTGERGGVVDGRRKQGKVRDRAWRGRETGRKENLKSFGGALRE